MPSPRYTKLRGNVYWFQLRVPKPLHATYGKKLIQESLSTTDGRRAAALALERAGNWKQVFADEIANLAGDRPRDIYQDTVRQVAAIKRLNRNHESVEAALDALWESTLEKEVARLGYSYHTEVPDDEWGPEAEAALEAIRNARNDILDTPPEYGLPFSSLASHFLQDRQRDQTGKLTEQTRVQMEAVYRLFTSHVDDAPLATIERRQVAAFFDKVKSLPRHWGRSRYAKERSLAQLVQQSVDGPKLSPRTINRYVSALNQLWEWASNRGEANGQNPFTGFSERTRRNRQAHPPWSIDAIRAYFASVTDKGTRGNPNPFHWLPRIALLTGMRLEEICSLDVSDIKSAEGVTYFDIVRGKTESAERVVPVHSSLNQLLMLAPEHGYLFPTLRPGGPDQKRSWNIGRRVNRLFRQFDGATDFHALRKNVAEVFERARVPETESAQILGHYKPGMTYGVYSPNGLTIAQKQELIEKLGAIIPPD